MSFGSLADSPSHSSSDRVLQCQSSLKQFSLHLEKCKGRGQQAYYEDLYEQTQALLTNLDTLPANPSQLSKCENLVKALHDIVGHHVASEDLGSMPTYEKSTGGKLTMPALERWRRPFSKNVHVRYVCEDPAIKKQPKENLDEAHEFDETSSTAVRVSRIRRGATPGEPKELER